MPFPIPGAGLAFLAVAAGLFGFGGVSEGPLAAKLCSAFFLLLASTSS